MIPPPPRASCASNASKPGGLSNCSLEHLSFPEAWDENLPRAALVLSHTPQNSIVLHPSLKKFPQNPLIWLIFPHQRCCALEMMTPVPGDHHIPSPLWG